MNHSGCITNEGKVYLWGITGDPSLGKKQVLLKIPIEVNFSKRTVIQDLKIGEGFTLALSNKGEVFAWGLNEFGQLAKDDLMSRIEPEKVHLP